VKVIVTEDAEFATSAAQSDPSELMTDIYVDR
jgi:hypothetical protein